MLDGTDAHLPDVARVAEQLVLEQDLLGHLLGRPGGQRPARRAQRLVLGLAGGRPAALASDLVHHRQVRLREGAVGGRLGLADERVRVDPERQLCCIVAGVLGGAAVELDQRREPLRLPADDRQRHREVEHPGARDGLGRPADRDPDRQRILDRARPHAGVLERRAQPARPGDGGRLSNREQQLQLLGKQLVVVVKVVTEQRERLDKRPPAGHDLGAPA